MSVSRYRGCLIGLAVGDALGTTLEFKRPGSFTPISDIVGGGPFRLKPGEWTDDTSMALCLAESLLLQKGFAPRHQLQTYCRWYHEGHFSVTGECFDIGNTTRAALHNFQTYPRDFAGSTQGEASGNGSIMRLAPVPMVWNRHPADGIFYAGQSSRTTHGSAECVDACRLMAGLILAAFAGHEKSKILAADYEPLRSAMAETPLTPKIQQIAEGSFLRKEPPAITGSGYVVHSLEAALWAFAKTDNFRDGALLAVNLGDDADTTGAVYGQIAGAFYGEDGIPAEWRAKLALRETIEQMAQELCDLAATMSARNAEEKA